jgi:hypothetical protein
LSAFGSEADMCDAVASTAMVANDPERTKAGSTSRSATQKSDDAQKRQRKAPRAPRGFSDQIRNV